MRSTLKLLNSYFWKTYYGPILSFVFPIILLGILGNIFRIEYVYPGIIAMSFLFIGLLSLPLSIMELKQSSLFKYIGSSPVNPIRFSLTVILFYICIAIITAIVILAATMAIFSKDVFPKGQMVYTPSDTQHLHGYLINNGFKNGILGGIFETIKGVCSFYVATGIHLVFTIAVGLLISTIAKTPQQALTTGLIILIPSIFLSGMILSVDIIAQSAVLNWISRLIPFRYSTGNIIIASTPLPQIGDMFERLSIDQKSILFKFVDQNSGVVTLHDFTNGDMTIHSMSDLKLAQHNLGLNMFNSIKDKDLYDLTFGVALASHADASDNNIFNWVNQWSVRRVPQVDQVQLFIKDYFSTFASGSNGKTDWSRLTPLANQIAAGKFGWLDIFMKQTNSLYTKADRVLNMLVPVTGTGLILWYVGKNFKWSAR